MAPNKVAKKSNKLNELNSKSKGIKKEKRTPKGTPGVKKNFAKAPQTQKDLTQPAGNLKKPKKEFQKKDKKLNKASIGIKKNSTKVNKGNLTPNNEAAKKKSQTNEPQLKKASPAKKKLKPSIKTETEDNDSSDETKEKRKISPELDAATVFVGNLPVKVNRKLLAKHFADFAPIKDIRLRTATGETLAAHKQRREAGSLNAYVVFEDSATAERALSLNNSLLKGNHLRVTRVDKTALVAGNTKSTVLVGNLRYSANEDKLREIFCSCGDIEYIRCIRSEKGCIGVAYVCFKSPDAVGLALELKKTMLDERPINVERYSTNKLGAKVARDEQAAREKSGVQRRLEKKQKGKGAAAAAGGSEGRPPKQNKKGDYRGMKIGAKKQHNKKAKGKKANKMNALARKIAPRQAT